MGRGARVLVADADLEARRPLADAVRALPGVASVIETGDGEGAITAAPASDVVLMDVGLAGPQLQTARTLCARDAELRIILVGAPGDADLVHTALRAGALSFLARGGSPAQVRDAVLGALEGRGVLDREVVQTVLDRYASVLEDARERDRAVIASLAAAVEAKDVVTSTHLRAVSGLSCRLAELVDADLAASEEFLFGCLLHDIGKIGVPEHILVKPGPLDEAEWRVMRRHPQTGARVVRPLGLPGTVLDIVLHHHERWDGEGYPDGLAGEEIPLCARIFSVCDAYDAMTADRPYRPGMAPRVAFERIRLEAGHQFDPHVVAVLERAVEDGRIELEAPSLAGLSEVPRARRITGVPRQAAG